LYGNKVLVSPTYIAADLLRSDSTKGHVGDSEGMSISGHDMTSTYKRYGIINEGMKPTALERFMLGSTDSGSIPEFLSRPYF